VATAAAVGDGIPPRMSAPYLSARPGDSRSQARCSVHLTTVQRSGSPGTQARPASRWRSGCGRSCSMPWG